MRHFIYIPFTGLGLYNGFRGNRWLRNRIKIFKQFVVPSLEAQTNQNFTIWVSWRREERGNKQVVWLEDYLKQRFENVIFTYAGVCFWDDKYDDETAHIRLIDSLHTSLGELINKVGDVEDVLMTIQPSDDCYRSTMVEEMQDLFSTTDYTAAGYQKGHIMNYHTLDVKKYDPETNPPFFTIKFPKDIFIDPLKHAQYTGPYKSHEYIPDYTKYKKIYERGFLVGTHGENISTVFDHPYAKDGISTMLDFPHIRGIEPLKIKYSCRKVLFNKLPYKVKRKLRYWSGEKKWILRPVFAGVYNFIRS